MKGLTFLELSFLEGRRRLRTLSPPLPLPLLDHSQLEFVLVNADPESLLIPCSRRHSSTYASSRVSRSLSILSRTFFLRCFLLYEASLSGWSPLPLA